MPSGSGKKGSRRKASQKKSTKAIKEILDESTESRTYRVKPASCEPLSSASHISPADVDLFPAFEDSPTITGNPFYPPPPPLHSDLYSSSYGRYHRQPPPLTEVTQHVTLPYSPVVHVPIVMGVSPHQQVGTSTSSTNAFWLTFVKGNISRCTGCGQRTLRGEDMENLVHLHSTYVYSTRSTFYLKTHILAVTRCQLIKGMYITMHYRDVCCSRILISMLVLT